MALACRHRVAPRGCGPLSDGDTIVALSSGAPPAAIAIVRISGGRAFDVARAMAGPLPPPRRASLRSLFDGDGELLDRALLLVFPAANSATGEDLVELHCHGGRAVVAAVEAAVAAHPGVRRAGPGEFTRRALLNGRIDLAQAQGLADLLAADTESQRRLAVRAAEGDVSRAIRGWVDRLTAMAVEVEASIEFGEEGDVAAEGASLASVVADRDALVADMTKVLAAPPVERWRDGWRIAVAGPPNAGKSTLVNLLAQRDAAIVSPIAGTTRDVIEVPVQRGGVGYVLIDTAGLREDSVDPIERQGIALARRTVEGADLLLWVDDDPPPVGSVPTLWVFAKADLLDRVAPEAGETIAVRRDDPPSILRLWDAIGTACRSWDLPPFPLHDVERRTLMAAVERLDMRSVDVVLFAEELRSAARMMGSLLGIDATEAMLDRLFAGFCIGK